MLLLLSGYSNNTRLFSKNKRIITRNGVCRGNGHIIKQYSIDEYDNNIVILKIKYDALKDAA